MKLDGFDAASKIKVIKEIRSVTELGLKEAKELVSKARIYWPEKDMSPVTVAILKAAASSGEQSPHK